MKKSELKKLMKKYLVFESDIDNICDFCSVLLEARARDTAQEYPYATKTIQRYKDAAFEVYDLIDYIEEVLEGEDE